MIVGIRKLHFITGSCGQGHLPGGVQYRAVIHRVLRNQHLDLIRAAVTAAALCLKGSRADLFKCLSQLRVDGRLARSAP